MNNEKKVEAIENELTLSEKEISKLSELLKFDKLKMNLVAGISISVGFITKVLFKYFGIDFSEIIKIFNISISLSVFLDGLIVIAVAMCTLAKEVKTWHNKKELNNNKLKVYFLKNILTEERTSLENSSQILENNDVHKNVYDKEMLEKLKIYFEKLKAYSEKYDKYKKEYIGRNGEFSEETRSKMISDGINPNLYGNFINEEYVEEARKMSL